MSLLPSLNLTFHTILHYPSFSTHLISLTFFLLSLLFSLSLSLSPLLFLYFQFSPLIFNRKDARLPFQLQRAMAAEAEATREARAKVIAAEGEQRASRALKEAAEVIACSPAALQLRYLQTLNSIASEKNSTIVFPVPMELFRGYTYSEERERERDELSEKQRGVQAAARSSIAGVGATLLRKKSGSSSNLITTIDS